MDILVSNAGYGKRIPDIWLVPILFLPIAVYNLDRHGYERCADVYF